MRSIQLFVKCSNTTIIACVYRLSLFSTMLSALFKATNSQLIITTQSDLMFAGVNKIVQCTCLCMA